MDNKTHYYYNRLNAMQNLLSRAKSSEVKKRECEFFEQELEFLLEIEAFVSHIEKLCQDVKRSVLKDIS